MSGSGKTTLLKLLMRYYQLDTNGTIRLDNVNLNQISLVSLYQLINIIQQDVYIFDNSLAYNITLGKSFTDQELHEAIKQAGLKPLVDVIPKVWTCRLEKQAMNYPVGKNNAFPSHEL